MSYVICNKKKLLFCISYYCYQCYLKRKQAFRKALTQHFNNCDLVNFSQCFRGNMTKLFDKLKKDARTKLKVIFLVKFFVFFLLSVLFTSTTHILLEQSYYSPSKPIWIIFVSMEKVLPSRAWKKKSFLILISKTLKKVKLRVKHVATLGKIHMYCRGLSPSENDKT